MKGQKINEMKDYMIEKKKEVRYLRQKLYEATGDPNYLKSNTPFFEEDITLETSAEELNILDDDKFLNYAYLDAIIRL